MEQTHRYARQASAAFAFVHALVAAAYAFSPPPLAGSGPVARGDYLPWLWAALHAAVTVLLAVGLWRGPGVLVVAHMIGAGASTAFTVAILLDGYLLADVPKVSPGGTFLLAIVAAHVYAALMWRVSRDRKAHVE